MIIYFKRERLSSCRRVLSSFVLLAFAFTSVLPSRSYAQSINLLKLPVPGAMVNPSPAFVPVLLKGMTIHPEDPMRFDFIIDSGNSKSDDAEIKKESETLVKYFLASMTVPQNDLWVNLSPYEKDRIIPDELGKTELGRDMLAQDYILKQLTASLIDPQKDLGKKFWGRVYKKAQEKYGTTDIPTDTFNKVWVIPESASVYENGKTVYVVEGHLKVMLEEDYEALRGSAEPQSETNGITLKKKGEGREKSEEKDLTSSILREILIPEIEKEVNQGKNFATLRQIYYSLILAKWYKETIKESLLSKVYINQNKIAGIAMDDDTIKDQIYGRYMEAYKKGVFNLIKEDYDQLSQEVIPRKYFSGGIKDADIKLTRLQGRKSVEQSIVGENFGLSMRIEPQGKANSDGAMLAQDVRMPLIQKLRSHFKEKYIFYPGGFASLDITQVDKRAAISDIFKREGIRKAFYFGDEFFKSDKKIGNDTPILEIDEEGKEVVMFSVDKDPNRRTEEAKQKTIWIGAGPAATQKVLDAILQAIKENREEVVIRGEGPDSNKTVPINLDELRRHSFLLFDIDGTILEKKENTFSNQEEMRVVFSGLLEKNLSLGIISGNSKAEQMPRIADPLRQETNKITNFIMYVNGGATRVTFNNAGTDLAENLVADIPVQDIEAIKDIVRKEASQNFGLSEDEIRAWKVWFNFDGTFGIRPDFPNVRFRLWTEMPDFTPEIINAKDIEAAAKGEVRTITTPSIQTRDGVSASIKLLPGSLEILPYAKMRQQLTVLVSDPTTGLNQQSIDHIIDKIGGDKKAERIPYKGEEVDIIKVVDGQEVGIGPIDMGVAHSNSRLMHRTSNAFIVTPDGKILIQRRVHNKAYALNLSIFGGHVSAGHGYMDTMKKEIKEELGLPDNWELQGKFEIVGKEGSFESPEWDKLNQERRSLYFYRATAEELGMVRRNAQQLIEEKKIRSKKEFEEWIENQQKEKTGMGEAWAIYEFPLEDINKIASGEKVVLRDQFKDGVFEEPAVLTGDLLKPLTEDSNVMGKLRRFITHRDSRYIPGHNVQQIKEIGGFSYTNFEYGLKEFGEFELYIKYDKVENEQMRWMLKKDAWVDAHRGRENVEQINAQQIKDYEADIHSLFDNAEERGKLTSEQLYTEIVKLREKHFPAAMNQYKDDLRKAILERGAETSKFLADNHWDTFSKEGILVSLFSDFANNIYESTGFGASWIGLNPQKIKDWLKYQSKIDDIDELVARLERPITYIHVAGSVNSLAADLKIFGEALLKKWEKEWKEKGEKEGQNKGQVIFVVKEDRMGSDVTQDDIDVLLKLEEFSYLRDMQKIPNENNPRFRVVVSGSKSYGTNFNEASQGFQELLDAVKKDQEDRKDQVVLGLEGEQNDFTTDHIEYEHYRLFLSRYIETRRKTGIFWDVNEKESPFPVVMRVPAEIPVSSRWSNVTFASQFYRARKEFEKGKTRSKYLDAYQTLREKLRDSESTFIEEVYPQALLLPIEYAGDLKAEFEKAKASNPKLTFYRFAQQRRKELLKDKFVEVMGERNVVSEIYSLKGDGTAPQLGEISPEPDKFDKNVLVNGGIFDPQKWGLTAIRAEQELRAYQNADGGADGRNLLAHERIFRDKERKARISINGLYFFTPKLFGIYNGYVDEDAKANNKNREDEKIKDVNFYLDSYQSPDGSETVPLYNKAYFGMSKDGKLVFGHRQMLGGRMDFSIDGEMKLILWTAGQVENNPGKKISSEKKVIVYTPMSSKEWTNEPNDADNDYIKPVGQDRYNIVIVNNKIIAIKSGDVLLPPVGIVVSLTRDKFVEVFGSNNLERFKERGNLPKPSFQFEWPGGEEKRPKWYLGGGTLLVEEDQNGNGQNLVKDKEAEKKYFGKEGWFNLLSMQTQETQVQNWVRGPRMILGNTKSGKMFAFSFSGRSATYTGANFAEAIKIIKRELKENNRDEEILNAINLDGGSSVSFNIKGEDGEIYTLSWPATGPDNIEGISRPVSSIVYFEENQNRKIDNAMLTAFGDRQIVNEQGYLTQKEIIRWLIGRVEKRLRRPISNEQKIFIKNIFNKTPFKELMNSDLNLTLGTYAEDQELIKKVIDEAGLIYNSLPDEGNRPLVHIFFDPEAEANMKKARDNFYLTMANLLEKTKVFWSETMPQYLGRVDVINTDRSKAQPKISVGVVVLTKSRFVLLLKRIEEIARSHWQEDMELVITIADPESFSEQTRQELIERLKKLPFRSKIVDTKKNTLAINRNLTVLESSGTYQIFVDDDVELVGSVLENLIKALEKKPELGIVSIPSYTKDGHLIKPKHSLKYYLDDELMITNIVLGMITATRREIIKVVPFAQFLQNLGDDIHFVRQVHTLGFLAGYIYPEDAYIIDEAPAVRATQESKSFINFLLEESLVYYLDPKSYDKRLESLGLVKMRIFSNFDTDFDRLKHFWENFRVQLSSFMESGESVFQYSASEQDAWYFKRKGDIDALTKLISASKSEIRNYKEDFNKNNNFGIDPFMGALRYRDIGVQSKGLKNHAMLSNEEAERSIKSKLGQRYHVLITPAHIQRVIELNGVFNVVVSPNEKAWEKWKDIEDYLIESSRDLGIEKEKEMRERQDELMSQWTTLEIVPIEHGEERQDNASLSDVGGIDMNEINLKKQGAGIDVQFDPTTVQPIFEPGFTGFKLVIINFVPIPSILPFLGLEPANRETEYEVSSTR
jgi:hydroxymethylpyrimidine pyrophosphatase-like HAD family hydrolase/isopentenyldiphosphate isomerase